MTSGRLGRRLVTAAAAALGLGAAGCVESALYERTAAERDEARRELAQRDQRIEQLTAQLVEERYVADHQRKLDLERAQAVEQEMLAEIRRQKGLAEASSQAIIELASTDDLKSPFGPRRLPPLIFPEEPTKRPVLWADGPTKAKAGTSVKPRGEIVDPWARPKHPQPLKDPRQAW